MVFPHYDDVIMVAIASQITSLMTVYSTVYSGTDQRKHQSPASLAFVWGIRRGPANSPHNGQLRGKCFHLMTSHAVGLDYILYAPFEKVIGIYFRHQIVPEARQGIYCVFKDLFLKHKLSKYSSIGMNGGWVMICWRRRDVKFEMSSLAIEPPSNVLILHGDTQFYPNQPH